MAATQPPQRRHWPKGLPYSLEYPDVPVTAVLAGAARRFPDRVGFTYAGRDLTYAQVWRQACRFAHGLRARGIGPGDVVAVHMPNCPQFPVAYYGTLLAGAAFSPVDPRLTPEELAFQLGDCGADALVTCGPMAEVAAAAFPGTVHPRTVVVTDRAQSLDPTVRVDVSRFGLAGVDFEQLCAGRPETPPKVDLDTRRDPAHISYTGGTTGKAKGVVLPHRNVVVNCLQLAAWINGAVPRLDETGGLVLHEIGDREDFPVAVGTGVSVNVTPWSHAMGTVGYLNMPVLQGTTIVIQDRFDPAAYLAACEKFRATLIGGAPLLFAALLACPDLDRRDLSSVRVLTSGAAPMPVHLIQELEERFPQAIVVEAYGLTEATLGVTANPFTHRSGLRKPGSVGLPVFDTEIKIVPLDDDAAAPSRALPPGEEGEICVRGPQVMVGYRNQPEETAAVLGSDGWLRTGDVGVLDEDGYLRIVDRKKDTLIYKGYSVYPRELETILFAHPAVANVAVVGKPDAAVGELATAFVVLAPGQRATAQELMDYVNARVVPYKRLRDVRFVHRIPVSTAGKVLKRELRQQLCDG